MSDADFGADPALVASQSSQQVVSTKGFDPGELTDGDILEMAGRAVTAVRALPAGFRVDPGAGSASDRLQFGEPSIKQCSDMARRGGSYETLYAGSTVERIVIHVVRAALARIEARSDATVKQGAAEGESRISSESPNQSTTHWEKGE